MKWFDLKAILKRNDIIPEQLFFHISSEIGNTQMIRIIKDLGVGNPQIVNDTIVNDTIELVLAKYFEIYPMTAYIQRIINALREVQANISSVLQAESEKNISINSGIRQKIDSLDVIVHKLKNAA